MASVTYWNRLEPRPRSRDLTRALSARVRDPLWMLTRQWQFGEFQGEDAGSPAWVSLDGRIAPLQAFRPTGTGPYQDLAEHVPLEAQALSEPFRADLTTRVELGQIFERALVAAGFPEWVGDFRNAYPITRPPEAALRSHVDRATARFLRVCGGRAIDGVALIEAATLASPNLPPNPPIPPGAEADRIRDLLDELATRARSTLGEIGEADPAAWRPERLEYALDVRATSPDGEPIRLTASPTRDGTFDWHSFDLGDTGEEDDGAHSPERVEPRTFARSMLPIHARFPGMPNKRWWRFEDGRTDFGKVTADRRDVGRLLAMDFMLVHGNDWLVVPFDQPWGTTCKVDRLLVFDVFGDVTVQDRADQAPVAPEARWSLFSITALAAPSGFADFFILSPSAPSSTLTGATLEEIRLLRDEMANMAWAIEHVTENAIGQPWPGHERDQAQRSLLESLETVPEAAEEPLPLRYRLGTRVPEHWFPLLPVAIDAAKRDVALELGSMLRSVEGGPAVPIEPTGRVLRPTLEANAAYTIREEEVPRIGARVTRFIRRCRGTDGSTHLWISRRRRAGSGPGSSGLRFDLALTPADREPPVA